MENHIYEELIKDIRAKEKGYNRNSIRSQYNTESNYKKRYKGREILELIQNAEDANADELIFNIDPTQKKLIISNNGVTFSSEGYSSLLYPNISSKTKGAFIGQKGLGFRALINWAKEISVISNNLRVTFSENLSQNLLKELKSKNPELKDINDMEFLSIPEVEKLTENQDGVTIEIVYKENIDFEKQFNAIDEECFFFLKNLITIKTPNKTIKKNEPKNIIFEEITKELPDNYYEKEELENKDKQKLSYNIKLVWNPDKNYQDYPLYTYFKTNVKIGSPILIHAGFDLSDDRNSIEPTKRNEFLVKEVCKLIENLIDKITLKHKDWSAYKLLSHQIQCERGSIFENLKTCFFECKNQKRIYPSIDGELKSINEIIVLDNEVSEFIINLRKKYNDSRLEAFDDVAVPITDDEIQIPINSNQYYDIFNLLSQIIPPKDQNERCRLIKLFHKYANDFCPQKPAIFIDNNNEIIPEDDEVFSAYDKNFEVELIPSFCKYRALNSDINRKLINEKLLTQEEIDSCINKTYSGNITSIFLILSSYLTQEISEKQKIEIYSNLFKIYKKYGNEIEHSNRQAIPILCNDNSYYSENVIFDYGFNANDDILNILEVFLNDTKNIHLIAPKEYWNFLSANDIELKNFFKFLNVTDSIEYDNIDNQADLFIKKLTKEDIVKLAIIDDNFYEYIKKDNNITETIKSNRLFSDYVINTKKINFLNNGLFDKSEIKKLTKDDSKINSVLKYLGAQDTIETLSAERFNLIIKNLRYWDPNGEFAGTIYDQAFKNEVKIKGETFYYSKDRNKYLSSKELFYYDNKCLPSSKLKEFPTIDLGRRKGHEKVSERFNVKSIENYKTQIIGKPEIDTKLSQEFLTDFMSFSHLILAYRFCSASSPLSDEMKRNQAKALKNIDIKICRDLCYTFNNTYNKEYLKDYDFINADGIFYYKIPNNCVTVQDIKKNRIELYDFISEMLLMTFKLTDNNSYIKDTAVQTYIFNDLNFSVTRFEEDNDRTILREAEEYLDIINHRENFWKHIWKLKNVEEDYETWEQKQATKKSFSTLDYTVFDDNMAAIFEEDDVNIDIKEFFKEYPYKTYINFLNYNKEQFKNIYNYKIKNNLEKYIWLQCSKKVDNQPKFQNKRKAIHWENISYLFNPYNYPIEDYEKELWIKLKELNFDKDNIKEKLDGFSIDYENIYESNYKKFTNEEIDIIKQYEDTNSLLYFENTFEKIKISLEKYNKTKVQNEEYLTEMLETDEYDNLEWQDMTFAQLQTETSPINHTNIHKRTSYSSVDRSKNDIVKGRCVEKLALKILKDSNKYTDIKDVSDQGFGYDIECVEKATKTTFYVEVKSFEKGYFEITENEYNTWKNNKNNYVFFLINTTTIEYWWINGLEAEKRLTMSPNKFKCKLI